MKKSAFIFASAIVAAMMCVFTGCSDEDSIKMPGEVNEVSIEALKTTKTPVVFKQGSPEFYQHVKGKKWEEYDLPPVICEMNSRHIIELGYGPEMIFFNDGKVYCTLWTKYGIPWRRVSYWGLGELRDIWYKYVDDTYPQEIYLCDDFLYSKKNKTLIVGGQEVGVMSCETNGLKLYCLDDDYRTCDDYWPTYLPEDEEIITFDDCKEAYRYIINCARKQYGDVLKFSHFEFDLNELERKLDTEPE